jgi:uncharacterized protein (TIGR02466 family)
MAIESDNIVVWPSPFLFWTEIENHEELKKTLLPKIKKESEKEQYHTTPGKVHRRLNLTPQVWQCEVITNYFDPYESRELLMENLKSSIVENVLKKFYDDKYCPVPIKPKNHILKDIWFNTYKPGYWQEAHTHDGSTYSGIYILELNEENTTTFFNHGVSQFSYAKSEKSKCSRFTDPNYETKHIKEGNVLLFPSEFVHAVSVCSKQRTTISFNIKCEW